MSVEKLLDEFERVVREDEHEDSDSSNSSVRVHWKRLRDAIRNLETQNQRMRAALGLPDNAEVIAGTIIKEHP